MSKTHFNKVKIQSIMLIFIRICKKICKKTKEDCGKIKLTKEINETFIRTKRTLILTIIENETLRSKIKDSIKLKIRIKFIRCKLLENKMTKKMKNNINKSPK